MKIAIYKYFNGANVEQMLDYSSTFAMLLLKVRIQDQKGIN